jgi:hypothetical protein
LPLALSIQISNKEKSGCAKYYQNGKGFLAKPVYSSNASTASSDGTGKKNCQSHQIV